MDCYCDYEPAEFYSARTVTARAVHRCDECSRAILPGDRYEVVAAKWDGDFSVFKTCPRCVALRDFVKAHVPCFCWAHGNTIEDAIETARGWDHEAPGLLFGAYRRQVLIRRQPLPH